MESIIVMALEAINNMPKGTLKRNSHYYELLTYLNHTTAFVEYKKYDDAVIFAIRGLKLLDKYEEENIFIIKSKIYFEKTIEFLLDNGLVDEKSEELIKRIK